MTPPGPRRAPRTHRVGDRELEGRVAERKIDPGTTPPVAGRIRERFLKDPICGLIGAAAQRSWCAGGLERHREPRRRMALDQRLERCQPGRRLDDARPRTSLAERAD